MYKSSIPIEIINEKNIPPSNNIPPKIPPNMSPNSLYLTMLDILYSKYKISNYDCEEILSPNKNINSE